MSNIQLKSLNDDTFDSTIKSQKETILLGIHTDGCEPCSLQKKVWKQAVEDLETEVFTVDAADNILLAKRLQVDFVPTTLAVKDGELVGRLDGFHEFEELKEEFSDIL